MHLWGEKTEAFIDVWSIEHFASGIGVGYLVIFILSKLKYKENNKDYKLMFYMMVILTAYLWEVIEHYLETGAINDHITFWFQGVEFWGNRIIADPLLMLLGATCYLKYNFLSKYAQVFSITWIFSHVFIFPHSMYLQDKLLIKILS